MYLLFTFIQQIPFKCVALFMNMYITELWSDKTHDVVSVPCLDRFENISSEYFFVIHIS